MKTAEPLGRDGRIKIVDLGLSKLTRPEFTGTDITRSSGPETVRGIVMGSPGCMSLEQATGQPVDARTDVFSLGVVFFEMASGTLLSARMMCSRCCAIHRRPSSTFVRTFRRRSPALSRGVWRRSPRGVTTRRSTG